MFGFGPMSGWWHDEGLETRSGGSGGGGGSDDNGCGIVIMLFFLCCLISGTCNSSRPNENYFRSPNHHINAVENVDSVAVDRFR